METTAIHIDRKQPIMHAASVFFDTSGVIWRKLKVFGIYRNNRNNGSESYNLIRNLVWFI